MTAQTRSNGAGRGPYARLGALLFILCGACGGSQDATYPSLGADNTGGGGSGGSTSLSGTGGGAGAGTTPDAGAQAETGSTDTDDGATPSGGDAGSASAAGSQCDPATTWAPLNRVDSIPADLFARLGGVSGDELTVAFTSLTGDAYAADRSSITADFAQPVKVNDSSTPLAVERVALGPTGMSAIAVSGDRHSFLGFERATRSDPWVPTSGLEFTLLRDVLESGAAISSPVLGGDKRTLFFIITYLGKATMYESHWDMAQRFWGMAATVTGGGDIETPDPSHLRRPTGASTDGRTLFFFDEGLGIERGAWRASSGAPFTLFVTLGSMAEAVPTSTCDGLYHQRQDDTGTRLFLAD